jgi:pentatricopeptide repeat protein
MKLRYTSGNGRQVRCKPREDHYTCMVDLLGKAGHIQEAEELISRMPFRPRVLVWQALLSACQLHGEKEVPSTYLLLSRTLAGRHNWNGAGRLRGLMGDKQVMTHEAAWV